MPESIIHTEHLCRSFGTITAEDNLDLYGRIYHMPCGEPELRASSPGEDQMGYIEKPIDLRMEVIHRVDARLKFSTPAPVGYP